MNKGYVFFLNQLIEKTNSTFELVANFLVWNLCQIAFTRKKNFGREERELKWAHAQRTLHGLHPPETKMFGERTPYTELNHMAEEAKRRAEIARYESMLFYNDYGL